jgi:hypothetical protein
MMHDTFERKKDKHNNFIKNGVRGPEKKDCDVKEQHVHLTGTI